MIIDFSGEVWYWRGPAPFYFVTIPELESSKLKEVKSMVTYGWGMIPVNARIGKSAWYTALWPKGGKYILPLKSVIRNSESIAEGSLVAARLEVVFSPSPF